MTFSPCKRKLIDVWKPCNFPERRVINSWVSLIQNALFAHSDYKQSFLVYTRKGSNFFVFNARQFYLGCCNAGFVPIAFNIVLLKSSFLIPNFFSKLFFCRVFGYFLFHPTWDIFDKTETSHETKAPPCKVADTWHGAGQGLAVKGRSSGGKVSTFLHILRYVCSSFQYSW